MQLVSWNLNGLEDQHLDQRTEAAMFQMLLGSPLEKALKEGFKPNTPDVIVLQEVVSRTFHAHITPHLKAAGFEIFPKEPSERSYFEIIASRIPIEQSSYTSFDYSDQGRGLSTVTLNNQITIMTAHMESMKPGSSMRLDQAKYILEKMNNCETPCIFAGDTNLRTSEWKSLEIGNIQDAWEVTGSSKTHKHTWQIKPYKARYDRVWAHNINAKSFETFGHNKIVGINEPSSDHRGIRVIYE